MRSYPQRLAHRHDGKFPDEGERGSGVAIELGCWLSVYPPYPDVQWGACSHHEGPYGIHRQGYLQPGNGLSEVRNLPGSANPSPILTQFCS